MPKYRVSISSGVLGASYVEKWEADSPREAEDKARQRWQREFKDAGAFHFYAQQEGKNRYLMNDDESA